MLVLLVFSSCFQLYPRSRWSRLGIDKECHPILLSPNGVNAWLPSFLSAKGDSGKCVMRSYARRPIRKLPFCMGIPNTFTPTNLYTRPKVQTDCGPDRRKLNPALIMIIDISIGFEVGLQGIEAGKPRQIPFLEASWPANILLLQGLSLYEL